MSEDFGVGIRECPARTYDCRRDDRRQPQAAELRADIIDGYFDGREDARAEYPEASNRSAFYRHGWLNGRDDRVGKPRATAQQIRDELAALARTLADADSKEPQP